LRDEPLVPAKRHRLRTAPGRGVRKAAKAVAARPVVHEEPADPVEDEPSLSRARVAYDTGNQALFAGDSAGAIRAYRQVLGFVPTYAAGFRGLGLAHAQQGDVGAAIMALRTYLTLAPQARDVGLIKKRIAILQAASAAERSAQRTDR
ncbi:MAG TPA: tetratricopeptide repeat protein, partial [Kofleriaceae bacterium]